MPVGLYCAVSLVLFGAPLAILIWHFGKPARRCKFCSRVFRTHQVCMNVRKEAPWCQE
jgi:hypothetical protein